MKLFHFHSWSNWGDCFVARNELVQARYCLVCACAQIRKVA